MAVVGDGIIDNGNNMHPTIGELAPSALTTTALPATKSKTSIINYKLKPLILMLPLTGVWSCQW